MGERRVTDQKIRENIRTMSAGTKPRTVAIFLRSWGTRNIVRPGEPWTADDVRAALNLENGS